MGGIGSGRPGGSPEIHETGDRVRIYEVACLPYSIKLHPDVREKLKIIGAANVRLLLDWLLAQDVDDVLANMD